MSSRLGQRIRSARERKGLTQSQLGQLVGVARETVGNWETGETSPRNRLARLIEVLEDDLGTGLVGADVQAASHVSLDLGDAIEGLTPAEQEEVALAARLAALQKAREIRGSQK